MANLKKKPKYVFVWRLEDTDGAGIYRGGHTKLNESYAAHVGIDSWVYVDSGQHPTPWDDKGLRKFLERKDEFEDYFFGFATLDQYHAWFFRAAWRKVFNEVGVRLVKYQVAARYAVLGNAQAMFRKDKAKIVEVQCP